MDIGTLALIASMTLSHPVEPTTQIEKQLPNYNTYQQIEAVEPRKYEVEYQPIVEKLPFKQY